MTIDTIFTAQGRYMVSNVFCHVSALPKDEGERRKLEKFFRSYLILSPFGNIICVNRCLCALKRIPRETLPAKHLYSLKYIVNCKNYNQYAINGHSEMVR